MTAVAATDALLEDVARILLLVENLHDPRAPHGTLTTPELAAGALRDADVTPTPELVEHVLALVATRRPGVSAA